jgi:ParB/RepB/Spo0J family partition protein
MKIEVLGIKDIRVGYHPRRGSRGLEELKEQIQRDGLKEPLRVRPENDRFVIIDGNRRFLVLKELDYETVPCIIEEIDERNAAHLSYLLNSEDCRRNLNPIEVSLHIKEIRERFGFSVRDLISMGYAKGDQTLYNKLGLLSPPQEIQDKIAEGTINPTEGYRLAAMKDAGLQKKATEIVLASKDRSVRKTEKIIKSLIASEKQKKPEQIVPGPVEEGDIPGVFFHDSGDMHEFKNETIPLIVVSPSYGVGMEYEERVSFDQHIADLRRCVPEWGRKLMKGGHLCINFGDIHNFGTKNGTEPEIQLMGQVFQDLLRPLSIRLRDIIVWDKGLPWVTNPQVMPYIDTPHTEYRLLNSFEYIYIFKKDGKRGLPIDAALKSKITEDEWKKCVPAVWNIRPVHRQKGHPAQFPEELPRRLIKMFSCEGDIVVDTALGSGTTIKVARELNRQGFGYERDLRYKRVIMKKLGLKQEDFKKPEEVQADLTDEERREAKKTLVNDILPAIVADANTKEERIAGLIVPVKRNLSKKNIKIETVPVEDDPFPTGPLLLKKEGKPDDYEEDDESRGIGRSTLERAA